MGNRGIIIQTIEWFFEFLQFAVFFRVIISWFPIQKENKFIYFLNQITDPILQPIKNIIQKSSFTQGMMIDFSPIVALLILNVVKSVLLTLI